MTTQTPLQTTMLVNDSGNIVTEITAIASGSATAIYTAEAASKKQRETINSIVVTNPTGSPITVTADLYRNSVAYEFYPATSLASKGRLTFPSTGEQNLGLAILPGDVLRVTGNGVHAFVTARVHQGNG